MRNCLKFTLSFLLLFGLLILCWGVVTASSFRSSSPHVTAAASAPSPPQGPGLSTLTYPTDVLTYHYDMSRQGVTSQETILTPSNVNSSSFGKVSFFSVDGKVDAQPLYLNTQTDTISGVRDSTVFVATEHDSVYAFGANSGTQFWRVSALGQGETTSDNHGCGQISPEIGITGTPVIDRQQGPSGAIYFVAMSKDSSGHYHQRLHALDLRTGAELFGGPTEIMATYPGSGDGSQGGQVIFAPGQYAERTGLLELGGTIYIAFTSHCDQRPYTGWVMGYNSQTLAQTSVLDVTPNGNEGAIWMAGAGLAADSQALYFLDGNGTQRPGISREWRLWQCLHEDLCHRSARRRRLLHHVQHGAGVRQR